MKYAYVGIAAAAVAIAIVFLFPYLNSSQTQLTVPPIGIEAYTLEISYETVNSDLKNTLIHQQINMSSPLKFSTTANINQYCNFLSNQTKQAMIEYCTSTELKDTSGNFLGDFNMVGSSTAPVLVIAAIQSDPVFSNYNKVKTVFGDVVNETICQCWSNSKPGGYTTISDMMDALRTFHLNGKQPNSTTHAVPLGGVHFEIELTTNSNGYVWKLLVAK